MKLLHFDDFKLGVLKGDAVLDVSAEVKDIPHTGPGDLMNGLIEHWGSYKPRLEAAVAPIRTSLRSSRANTRSSPGSRSRFEEGERCIEWTCTGAQRTPARRAR